MKISFKNATSYCLYMLVASLAFMPVTLSAQKMKHASASAKSAPAKSKPAAGGPSKSINGGSQKSPDRKVGTGNNNNKGKAGNKADVGDKNKGNAGNKVNVGDNNKINIDNSKKDVNINIDNSKDIKINNNRNTVVRHNNRPYGRPPYRYGGHRYYCYHPYHYHPYRPFYWGPVWHPWGFFITTMAATAIIVSVNSQQYHYDQGVYYSAGNGGYTVVQAPVGATITTMPPNSQTVVINETTNNYYYGGAYYEKSSGGYTVVAPTAGSVVENLPEGGEEVRIGDVTYVKYGETYYQPIEQNGKSMYEVVEVEAD